MYSMSHIRVIAFFRVTSFWIVVLGYSCKGPTNVTYRNILMEPLIIGM